jgi:hypothetical protein
MKQGDALSLFLFNFALEYAIRKVLNSQVGLELNGTHQQLVHGNAVSLFDDSINTKMDNKESFIEASVYVCLEISAEKTKYMIMSLHPKSGKNLNILIANE